MIEREMGVGTFGRVFLCEDTEYRRAVALKVVRKVKKYTESARIEADVLIDVRIKMREVGNNSCVYLYDHFKFQGTTTPLSHT
jgi:serine/threonine protein kinase